MKIIALVLMAISLPAFAEMDCLKQFNEMAESTDHLVASIQKVRKQSFEMADGMVQTGEELKTIPTMPAKPHGHAMRMKSARDAEELKFLKQNLVLSAKNAKSDVGRFEGCFMKFNWCVPNYKKFRSIKESLLVKSDELHLLGLGAASYMSGTATILIENNDVLGNAGDVILEKGKIYSAKAVRLGFELGGIEDQLYETKEEFRRCYFGK